MKLHQLEEAGLDAGAFDVERAIATARLAVDLAIVPSFLVRVLDPFAPGPLTAKRIYYEHFNDALVEATGFAGHMRLDELLPPRGAETVMANYRAALGSAAPIGYREDVETPSGAASWHTTIKILRTPGEVPFAIIGHSADITETTQRELDDAAEIARLQRTVDEVRVFSSMAAHDVRSPLATIESLVELIREGFVDHGDDKIELIDHLTQVAETARHHMDEILRHSTTFTAPRDAETRVDLGHLCRDLAAIVDPRGEVEIAHPEIDVLCDRVALHLVLRNLLTNARRHCAGRIVIEGEPAPGSPGQMRFAISDDGPGFPEGFDPFAIDERTRAASAHGFGLAAVRYVVETRGGRVEVAPPALGRGATVAFTLPGRVCPAGPAESRAA